jgi:hypothetical protein
MGALHVSLDPRRSPHNGLRFHGEPDDWATRPATGVNEPVTPTTAQGLECAELDSGDHPGSENCELHPNSSFEFPVG